MAPKTKKPDPPNPTTSKPIEPQTIGAKLQAEYIASRPLQVLFETKGWSGLSANEKTAYTNFLLLESEAYLSWSATQQKDFLRLCETLKIPTPLPAPRSLGTDSKGRRLEDYTLDEYRAWEKGQWELQSLVEQSRRFREKARRERTKAKTKARPARKSRIGREDEESVGDLEKRVDSFTIKNSALTEEDIQEEKLRRVKIAEMVRGNMLGIYEGNPAWDDVVPIPQDDGERPLAAIAYTDEYEEAISYLRAVMAAQEHSPRVLDLTAHIIDLNPAHYTVWLYRASTLIALHSDLYTELQWVNEISLANEKNYQVWHHRQLLIDNLYLLVSDDRAKVLDLARSETEFMAQMFQLDSKNYHVWSYRQYLVRKLGLFPSQCDDPSELGDVESLLQDDIRNNSAWSHRFFLVFSDPGHSTEDSKATERDERIPSSVVEREVEFAKKQIWRAPQNQSPWNYLRGAIKKGGLEIAGLESFAGEFVRFDGHGSEDVKSSHALDFLADVWAEKGEIEKAERALRLLAEKYDRIRKNYWEWRREALEGLKTGA